MARPVKVQLLLEFDMQIQPGQNHRDLAVAVQQQCEAQGLTVKNVQIADGAASFSLFPPLGAQQAESDLADTAPFNQATRITGKKGQTRKQRAKVLEALGLPALAGKERRAKKRDAAQDGWREKDFKHDFQSAGFNKTLRSKCPCIMLPQRSQGLTILFLQRTGSPKPWDPLRPHVRGGE